MLIANPSILATLLLGVQLDTPVGLTVARLGGAALLAIGAACWLARLYGHGRVARGLAGAMIIYNAGTVAILVNAGLARLSGIGLWPAVVVHAAMTDWCITSLLSERPCWAPGTLARSFDRSVPAGRNCRVGLLVFMLPSCCRAPTGQQTRCPVSAAGPLGLTSYRSTPVAGRATAPKGRQLLHLTAEPLQSRRSADKPAR